MALLVAMATGCGGAHRYDSRLTAVDSLMQPDPDSALALVQAISPASLTTEGDRAYRDLLFTQARYKCFEDITTSDDSAINCVMDYYRNHSSEKEKLTRAYLYKGAVMEELGHVDSAMFYYKTAEVTADEKDYANLGQINTRIADLFRKNDGDVQICYEKYHQAYLFNVLAGNKRMQLNNLSRMFRMNGITRLYEQDSLYNKAVDLTKELENDKTLFHLFELRSRQMSLADSTRQEAKKIAWHCLENYNQYVNENLLLDLAYIYAKENNLDSARYFLQYVDESSDPDNEIYILIRKHEVLSIIALSEGNQSLRHEHIVINSQLTDSIMNNRDKYGIEQIENDFNQRKQHDNLSRIGHLRYIIYGLSILALLVVTFLSVAYLRRMRRTNAIIKELENFKPDMHDELLGQLDARDGVIERLLNNLVILMKSVAIKETPKSTTSQVARQIKDTIVNVANDDFWNELRTLLDKKHHGIISKFAQTYGFSEKDLRFIELSCCGFSYLEIAMIMDYSPRYVFNKRKVIASKMVLDMPLQDYLDGLMAEKKHSSAYQKQ